MNNIKDKGMISKSIDILSVGIEVVNKSYMEKVDCNESAVAILVSPTYEHDTGTLVRNLR